MAHNFLDDSKNNLSEVAAMIDKSFVLEVVEITDKEWIDMTDMGCARLGMMVADKLRKKRKMTRTPKHMVRNRVNLTSLTE